MKTPAIVTFLQRTPLLTGLDDTFIEDFAATCRVRKLGKGQVVFLQMDPAQYVYMVYTGAILISVTHEDGRELVLNEMQAGDLFGELSLFAGDTHSADAIARVRSQILVMPAADFLYLMDREGQLARRLLTIMAQRLRLSSDRESALAFLDAQARVARLLLLLEDEAGDKGYLTITQAELAQRLGLARQTVARILGKWRRSGWLITGRGRIMLLRPEVLVEIEERAVS